MDFVVAVAVVHNRVRRWDAVGYADTWPAADVVEVLARAVVDLRVRRLDSVDM
jgi:hypothetical protein